MLTKKIQFNILYAAIALLVCTVSCTEKITLPTKDSKPLPVVYACLSNSDDTLRVNFSRSSPYFSDDRDEGLSNAIITVSDNDNNVYLFTENDTLAGSYENIPAIPITGGRQYKLSIEYDFDGDGVTETYEAESEAIVTQAPDSLTIIDSLDIMGERHFILSIHFQDTPGEDYYLFDVLQNDSLLTDKITSKLVTNDLMFENQYITGYTGGLVLFEDSANYEKYPPDMRKYGNFLGPGDRLEVRLSKISKDYYNFIYQCMTEQGGENPIFGGPPSNIVTNISNGAVGFFTVLDYKTNSIVYKKEDE
jgi:hypothetical protein